MNKGDATAAMLEKAMYKLYGHTSRDVTAPTMSSASGSSYGEMVTIRSYSVASSSKHVRHPWVWLVTLRDAPSAPSGWHNAAPTLRECSLYVGKLRNFTKHTNCFMPTSSYLGIQATTGHLYKGDVLMNRPRLCRPTIVTLTRTLPIPKKPKVPCPAYASPA